MSLFADVILPLALADSYTYIIPAELKNIIQPGFRVIVPFGKTKFYTAIVLRIHQNKPHNITLKEIHSQLDSNPIVNQHQLKLWQWISFYYMSPLGDVYNAALPNQLKLESKAYISLLDNYHDIEVALTPTENEVVQLLLKTSKPLQVSEIIREMNNPNILSHINALSSKKVLTIGQTIYSKYKEKTENHIRIHPNLNIDTAEGTIGRAKKQLELYQFILAFFEENNVKSISRKELLEDGKFSLNILSALLNKNVLEQFLVSTSRLDIEHIETQQAKTLTPHQEDAYNEIKNVFKQKNVCLLHGVTSSGKTEVYIQLIQDALNEGKQVLYLVPEIALTTQLTNRLQAIFGNDLAIYHSKINDNVRAEIWLKMISSNPYKILIGVRSAVFMPFANLGLVVIDEEHDQSYRQTDPSPRYHGKNTAIMYAGFQNAKVLLGSATPAIESYYNALSGKYGLVTLTERYENMALPEIKIVDTKELRRKKMMTSLLSPILIDQMNESLSNNQQIILFRNRRGFAPIMECSNCAYIPKCEYCDVSLTYHKYQNKLKCHYCDATYPVITECPECHESTLQLLGSGTEQLSEEVTSIFPDAVVARMDTDTTRGMNSYELILNDFSRGKSQILVGTKMVSKGLDFDNVRVVGIIQADSLFNFPDFRSHEEGFQMITQASGRSGRKNIAGTVIIQTSNPNQPIFDYIKNNDYEGFFNAQLIERKLFNYPPYYRLIVIKLRDKNETTVSKAAEYFAMLLKKSLGKRVLGPAKPVVGRVKQLYINEILLKMELGFSITHIREIIKLQEATTRERIRFRYVRIHYEIDV
ncbi:MAG: primosomal protein N' [Dysgonamonadaceae bacterium]|nr:primosomal protein N' [Dysgonamonadaceae bacterium]MDD4727417.1 primosomal protein N' [Dysgonamonadaceae bacterium]